MINKKEITTEYLQDYVDILSENKSLTMQSKTMQSKRNNISKKLKKRKCTNSG